MPISITCSECDKKLKLADATAGKKIRCPACKTVIAVPVPEEASVEAIPSRKKPGKKSAGENNSTDARESQNEESEEQYGFDEKRDEEEEDEDERPRKKEKKKRRDRDDEDRRSYKPHRGVLIMILGIVSILIFCAPVISWAIAYRTMAMATEDLDEMSRRRMNPSGQGITQIGKVCAMIGSVLAVIWLLIVLTLKVTGQW